MFLLLPKKDERMRGETFWSNTVSLDYSCLHFKYLLFALNKPWLQCKPMVLKVGSFRWFQGCPQPKRKSFIFTIIPSTCYIMIECRTVFIHTSKNLIKMGDPRTKSNGQFRGPWCGKRLRTTVLGCGRIKQGKCKTADKALISWFELYKMPTNYNMAFLDTTKLPFLSIVFLSYPVRQYLIILGYDTL